MFTRFLKPLALGAAMVCAAGLASAQVQMIMSNDNNKGLKGQTFDYLVAQLEERLGDKINVEMHHSGTLFDQQSQIQGLQLGGPTSFRPPPVSTARSNPRWPPCNCHSC